LITQLEMIDLVEELVFVAEAAENWPALDPLLGKVCHCEPADVTPGLGKDPPDWTSCSTSCWRARAGTVSSWL
jgi:hypothetical protein